VLCIAGQDLLDEAAALMLAQMLSNDGLKARVLGPESLSPGVSSPLDPTGIALVCLSFLDAPSTVHIRYAVRRIRRKVQNADIIVGVWRERDPATVEDLRRQTSADHLVTSLRQALEIALELARSRPRTGPASASQRRLAPVAANKQ
jgi:hypothetical protein